MVSQVRHPGLSLPAGWQGLEPRLPTAEMVIPSLFQGGCESCQGAEDSGPGKSFPRTLSISQGLALIHGAFQLTCATWRGFAVCQAACTYVDKELRAAQTDRPWLLHSAPALAFVSLQEEPHPVQPSWR